MARSDWPQVRAGLAASARTLPRARCYVAQAWQQKVKAVPRYGDFQGLQCRPHGHFRQAHSEVDLRVHHSLHLGVLGLLDDELDSGVLVAPFGTTLDPRFAYYLAYLPGALERPKVRAFRDFLIEELHRSEAVGHGR